jgi:general secretion pathway protein K
MVLLALLMSQVMASSRVAVNLAANLRLAAQERAADDGAVQAAVFHLSARGAARWQPDGAARQVRIAGIAVAVQARSLGGMVNPNLASAALLAGLLRAVAVPADQASAIAGGIVAWRSPPASKAARAAALDAYRRAGRVYGPPGAPFRTLAELADVLGMTPAIAARLAPYLSLFQQGNPDRAFAAPAVRLALAQAAAGATLSVTKGASVVEITACAPAGLCRHAVVSLPVPGLSGAGKPTPFRMLQLN